MRRRDFIAAIQAAALASPSAAAVQQAEKIWRIGHVTVATPEISEIFEQALEQRLSDLGYMPGRNVVLLHRNPAPQPDKIAEVVVSLVPQVDLLVVWGSIAGMAAMKLAGVVPVVFLTIGFPVEIGLVQCLAHPGGNITGIAAEAATETNEKRLQILSEIVPDLKRVAVLRAVDDQYVGLAMTSLDVAADKLAINLLPVDIKSAEDLGAAFTSIRKSRAEALIVPGAALVFTLNKRIAELALTAHLPSCHMFRDAVAAGGLVSLAPDRLAMIGRAAAQIDKIIRGASPANIPVEQPTRLELCINLRTARLLNLTIPPAMLASADEVIE